jgi:tetratricopeptide (TPR) repeat protein
MTPPNDNLQQAETLYEQGLFVSAYRAAEPLGKLGKWPGVHGRIMAGRLAYQLGRAGWGTALHQLALRESPEDPRALYYGGLASRSRRGPLRTWLQFRNIELPPSATHEQQADWLSFKGSLLGSLRDFQRSQKLIDRSLELSPGSAWNHLVQADLYRMRDQRDRAIEYCRKSLELHPSYRPSIQTLAEILIELNRDDEAYELLKQATATSESPLLVAQLAFLCLELEKYDETLELLSQYKKLAILAADKSVAAWLNMMRARTLYLAGRYAEAIPHARDAELDYCSHFADRLEQTLNDKLDPKTLRVQIPVTFIRQHRSTCAPATLAALSNFWEKPIKHEEIAERICYDGTLAHDERKWANDNGFSAREFCITSQSAHDLINAYIPFSLTTLSATSGHLQAVVGYDSIGEVLLIRDPSSRTIVEATTEKLLEYYASSGPRGMLIIPKEQESKLASIHLPEAELYDLQYEIDYALSVHQRQRAIETLERMQNIAPGHRLTLQSELSLRRYDGHNYDSLQLTQRLLEKYPNDLRLVLNRLDYLHEFGTRTERVELLQKALSDFGPAVRLKTKLAEEYLQDARELDRAESELRYLMRWVASDSHSVSLYACLAWARQRYDDSVELYRIAACLAEKDESYAQTFFNTAIRCHQAQSAVEWLVERHQQWGKLNCGPSITLAWAYENIQDIAAGLAIFQEALKWRPDDGHLLCSAALYFDRYGQHAEAQRLVQHAQGKAHQATLIRTKATLELNAGRLAQARDLFDQLLAIAPSDGRTLDTLLDLDLQLEDASSGERRLCKLLATWPQNTELQQRLVTWLRQFRPEGIQGELDKALLSDPNNAWLHREAAIAAIQRFDLAAAKYHVDLCIELEPNLPRNWCLLGQLCFELGDRHGVRDAAIKSLRLWIDNNWAMNLLISTCRSEEEFTADFAFLLDQLRTQSTLGDGILSYHKLATARRDAHQVLADMQGAYRARPELWQAWSALVKQYIYMGMSVEAFQLAKEFTERFPFLVESWLEYASACYEVDNTDLQLDALQRALQINPTSAEVSRQLSDVHIARGDSAKGIDVLRQALGASPRDAVLHGYLADILWREDKKSEAIEVMRKAVTLYPGYHWAWGHFGIWCHEMQLEDVAFDTAKSLVQSKLTETYGYIRLAELHLRWARPAQAALIAQEGLLHDPLDPTLHELHARSLDEDGQTDAALSACRPDIFNENIPATLLFLESDILYRRGKIEEAVKRRALGLEIAPDNYSDWRTLLDWTDEHGKIEDHVQYCQKFLSLTPSDAIAHGFYASALQKWKPDETTVEAMQEYEIAVRFDSTYAFAAYELFFLYLKMGKHVEAKQLIQSLPETLSKRVRDTMVFCFECCENPTNIADVLHKHARNAIEIDRYTLRRSLDITIPAQLQSRLRNVWLEEPNLGLAGTLWAEVIVREEKPTQVSDQLQHLPQGEAWLDAWEEILDISKPYQFPLELAYKINKKFRKQISARPSTWSAVSDYYLQRNQIDKVIQWCSNWKKVPLNHPRQLVDGIGAHWMMHNTGKAQQMLHKALCLPSESPDPFVALWEAASKIFQGNSQGVMVSLRPLEQINLGDWYRNLLECLIYLASQIDRMEQASLTQERKAIFKEISESQLKHATTISADWKRWYLIHVRQRVSYRFGLWGSFIRITFYKWLV